MAKLQLLSYYGAKNRIAPKYPAPEYGTIIEPFAGSAGYALHHHEKQVILVEKDQKVYGALAWLHRASAEEVLTLPLIKPGELVSELDVCQEAKWVIGFWVNNGGATPCNTLSAWARETLPRNPVHCWSPRCRARLARTAEAIKHWTIIHGDYTDAPDIEATWFIDPPYQVAGRSYRESAVDYPALAEWCKRRRGQVMVCENEGATWLPFRPFCETVGAMKDGSSRRRSKEAIWTPESGDSRLESLDTGAPPVGHEPSGTPAHS